jgi:DNA-binding transcriptional LysR family regulator
MVVDIVSVMPTFVQVAETGSFAAAGRRLGVSASAVSKSIGRLETRLGVQLVQRSTRSLALTNNGEAFLARCRRIIAEVEAAHAEMAGASDQPRGTLRISLPLIGAPFGDFLAQFQEAYPSVSLEVDLSNRYVDLVREGFDLAVRTGDLADSSLTVREIIQYRMILMASPDYLARRGVPYMPSDLAIHDRLHLRLSNTGRFHSPTFVDPADAAADAAARAAIVVSDTASLGSFALSGRGIAYLPDLLFLDELASGALLPVLPDHVREKNRFQLVWVKNRHVTPALRALIDFLVVSARALEIARVQPQ